MISYQFWNVLMRDLHNSVCTYALEFALNGKPCHWTFVTDPCWISSYQVFFFQYCIDCVSLCNDLALASLLAWHLEWLFQLTWLCLWEGTLLFCFMPLSKSTLVAWCKLVGQERHVSFSYGSSPSSSLVCFPHQIVKYNQVFSNT